MTNFPVPLDGPWDIPGLDVQLLGDVNVPEALLLEGDNHCSLSFSQILMRLCTTRHASSLCTHIETTFRVDTNFTNSSQEMSAVIWHLKIQNRTRNELTRPFSKKVASYCIQTVSIQHKSGAVGRIRFLQRSNTPRTPRIVRKRSWTTSWQVVWMDAWTCRFHPLPVVSSGLGSTLTGWWSLRAEGEGPQKIWNMLKNPRWRHLWDGHSKPRPGADPGTGFIPPGWIILAPYSPF